MLGKSSILAAFLIVLATAGSPSAADDASPYRLEGTVTKEGTGEPVAGAMVQVLIESESLPEQRIRGAKTDARGRYSVPLPIGHAVAWHVQPPAGFVSVKALDVKSFATTTDKPVFTKDYQVRPGVAWNVEARTAGAAVPLPKTYVTLNQFRENEYLGGGRCELDAKGGGTLTVPDLGGQFTISCGDMQRIVSAPDNMTVKLDKGFRTDRVTSVKAIEGGSELCDDDGRSALVTGATAEVNDGKATIVINVKLRPLAELGTIVGSVVDRDGRPLVGAEVMAAFHSSGGSGASELKATTDAAGKFRLVLPRPQPELQIGLVVTKSGFAGLDTEPRKVDFARSPEVDFGSIKLQPGSSIPIRVVGPDGQPLAGAVVEPSGSYAARAQVARTNSDGVCTLRDLAPGTPSVSARFGTLYAGGRVPLAAENNELLVLKLGAPRVVPANAPDKPARSLAVGSEAPDWEIAEWTDGQTRKLADYRGKIVVLDFWGTWCGPCVQMIPAMKELHEHFKDRDVVFLGIHTAGTDISLVKRLMKQQEWNAVTGLDTGDDIADGRSVQAFSVRGFPTILVIDRHGKIAFNSDVEPTDRETAMREMERLAKSIGLPWPPDKDASKDELNARLTRLQFVMFSSEIDKALKLPQ